MAFGLPQAFLLGTLFEAMLYGAYVIIFTEHMRILYRRRSHTWSHIYCQLTSWSLFILMTMSITLGITRCMQAFTTHTNTLNYPTIYYEAFNTLASEMRVAVYMAVTMVSDLFLVYRCSVIWESNRLVALIPFLIFLADLALAIWATQSLKMSTGRNFVGTPVILRSKYLFIVTLLLNLTCTALIAYKVWSVQRRTAPFAVRPHRLNRIIFVLVESAGVYSAFLIALITTDVIGSSPFFLIYDIMPPIIGISFSAIIVRSETAKSLGVASTIKFDSQTTGSVSTQRETHGVHIQLETFRRPPSLHLSKSHDEVAKQ